MVLCFAMPLSRAEAGVNLLIQQSDRLLWATMCGTMVGQQRMLDAQLVLNWW